MAKRNDKQRSLATNKEFGVMNLISFKPMTLFKFVVYDHEETSRFGIMRDEMNEKRKGESITSWEQRCEEVKQWNRRRAKMMQQIIIDKMAERFGRDNEAVQMLQSTYNMALAAEAQALKEGIATPLLKPDKGVDK